MLRFLVVFAAACTMAAALGTAFFTVPGEFNMTWMTGFFPPHRGYSAYIVCALVFLSPHRWLRGLAGVTLLLSGARAAWVGVLAGWGWRQGWRRPWLLGFLLAGGTVLGLAMKDPRVRYKSDSVRVLTYKAALRDAWKNPRGTWPEPWLTALRGREVRKAHSDVLELLVVFGWGPAALAVLLVALGLWRAPGGPWKDLLVALTAQSVIDNRLHHPACAALYALAWLGAWSEGRTSEPNA